MHLITPEFVILFAAGLCLLIAASLLLKQQLKAGKWVLVLFMLNLFAQLYIKVLDHSQQLILYPHLLNVDRILGLMRPPLFLLVIVYAVAGEKPRWYQSAHFIPIAALLFYLSPYYLLDATAKAAIESGELIYTGPKLPGTYRLLGTVYSVIYILLSAYYFWQHYQRNTTSANNKKRLVFAFSLFTGFLLFIIMGVGNSIQILPREGNYIVFLLLSIIIIITCLFMLTNETSFIANRKYPNSNLSEPRKAKYLKLLHDNFVQPELFCQYSKLQQVSAHLTIPENHISQLVNEEFGCTFSDWINRLRVNKAKELLTSGRYEHFTIEAIGLEAGFTSRVSFYTVFKSITGETPRNYKVKHTSLLAN